MIYLDTHVAVWLAAGEIARIPPQARRLINESDLALSPMVLLEMQFLKEVGRLAVSSNEILAILTHALHITVCPLPFDRVIRAALEQAWTRDPFDRLIVGQAKAANATLITKDLGIIANYRKAFWEENDGKRP
jgi:PIN domain nuclease of toxin-antitoxin system